MHGFQPAFVYPFAVNGLATFTQILMLLYGHRISSYLKIQVGFFINAVIMLLLPLLAHYARTPFISFWSCFSLLVVFGAINGVVQASVFGSAGTLPQKYIAAVMIGNGISGIVANALRVLLLLVLPGDENMFIGSVIFFIISAFILLLCSFSFQILD